ncbi:MAG: MFS transporter [candidate division KSB1 bacterium]|nr:MFS transporter [candidate division KSB1 bacterium]
MKAKNGRLSFFEKFGYSLGDVASNFYFQTFILFITYFYTDVYGISASAVATLFMVTRVWDAVNDPLMGMIADRTNTKMGKFRPFILWFAIPFGIIGVLTFTTPDFGMTGKIVYAYVTYILLIMLYTVVNVPYSALMGVLTEDPKERTVVASYRLIAAFVAGIIVQVSVMTLVRKLGGDNEQLGWQWTMSILSGVATVLLFITFAATKERVVPLHSQKTTMKQDFADLFKNIAWVCIAVVSVFTLIMIVVRNGSIMYYFKYYVKVVNLSFFGRELSIEFGTAASSFMIIGTILSIVGAILVGSLAKKIDKRKSYLWLLGLFAVTSVVFYVFSPDDFILMVLSQIIATTSLGALGVLQWSIFPDTADYSEWKTGRRATGLVMAASLFSIKLGLALGGSILAWLLALFGFQPNVAQSPDTLIGIRLIISVFPAVFAVLAFIVMWLYPLDQSILDQVESALQKRRQQKGGADAAVVE